MTIASVVSGASQRSPKTGIRFAFRCTSCGLNQEVHTRRGFYAHCRGCGTPNAGPALSRRLDDPVPVAPRGRPRKHQLAVSAA